jgi:hypothetical protein
LDSSFADVTVRGSREGFISDLASSIDGAIVIGGSFSFVNGVPRPQVARLHANGTVDMSFDPPATEHSRPVNAVLIQPDGRVILGGSFVAIGGFLRVGIARLTAWTVGWTTIPAQS